MNEDEIPKDRIARLEDLVERRFAAISDDWTATQIKEYIEAVMAESQRAIELAGIEREKAAAALRDQLTDRIAAGDTNLREHISSQVTQLRALVEGVENLSVTRHEAMRREAMIQHAADQAAITKAEISNESRFAAANEWRGQSADRERTQQEAIASFIATLTPLSKTEALEDKLASTIDRNRTDIENLTKRFDAKQNEAVGMKITASFLVTLVTIGIGILSVIILVANHYSPA